MEPTGVNLLRSISGTSDPTLSRRSPPLPAPPSLRTSSPRCLTGPSHRLGIPDLRRHVRLPHIPPWTAESRAAPRPAPAVLPRRVNGSYAAHAESTDAPSGNLQLSHILQAVALHPRLYHTKGADPREELPLVVTNLNESV